MTRVMKCESRAGRGTVLASRLPPGQRPSHKPAQGNALGKRVTPDTALKGRGNFVPPFQGSFLLGTVSQGVALGWLVDALSVLFAVISCSPFQPHP